MENFCSKITKNPEYSNLKFAIFTGINSEIENKINKFINSAPMVIKKVMQSESVDKDNLWTITITIFYNTKNPAVFLTKQLLASELADMVLEYIGEEYGLEFDDIVDLVFREKDKIKSLKNGELSQSENSADACTHCGATGVILEVGMCPKCLPF